MRLSELEASPQESPKEPPVKKESVRLSQLPTSGETPEFETAYKAGAKYFPETPLPQILAPTVAAGAGELVKGAGSALELVAPETGKKVREYGRGFVSGVQKGQPLGGIAGQIGSYAIPFTAAQKGVQALRGGQAATSSLGRAAEFGAAGGATGFATTHGSPEERTLAGALGGLGAGGFSIAFDVATKGLKYVSDTLRKAYGGDVKRLTEDLRSYATKRSGHEADLAKKLADEAEGKVAQAGVQAGEAESRAAVAEAAAGRQGRAVGTEYGRLPGVATKEEAGRMKPIPESNEATGTSLKGYAQQYIDLGKDSRRIVADKNFTSALNESRTKEASGQFVQNEKSFAAVTNYLDSQLKVVTDPTVRSQLELMKTALTKGAPINLSEGERRAFALRNNIELEKAPHSITLDPTFEGLEIMRRRIGDAAFGVPQDGYQAISQKMARETYDKLSTAMRDFSPSFSKYLSDYTAMSEPLRVAGSRVGKALVDKQLHGEGANYAVVAAEDIPARVFKNRENYGALLDALGGNKELAESAAKKYFVSQIEKLSGDPKKLENFIRDNRAMLNLTNARPVVEGYLSQAKTLTGREAAGTARAKSERATAEQLRGAKVDPKQAQLSQEFEKLQSDFITARTPGEVSNLYGSLADKLLRNKSINQKQYQEMNLEANKILNSIADSEEAKRNILGAAWRAFAGTGVPGAAVFTAIKSQGKR